MRGATAVLGGTGRRARFGIPARVVARVVIGLTIGVLLLASPTGRAADPPWADQFSGIEGSTRRLAAAGLSDDVDELIQILTDLGRDEKGIEALRKATDKTLARVKKPKPKQVAVAKRLRKSAAALAEHLSALQGEQRTALAETILLLDGEEETARAAAGHVRHEGVWVPAGMPEMLARRQAFELAAQQVRRMEIPLEVGPSRLPFVEQLHGTKGTSVKHACGFELHSGVISRHKIERVARETLRAMALVHFALTGDLEVPKLERPVVNVNVGLAVQYERAIALSVKRKSLTARAGAQAKGMGGYWEKGFQVMQVRTEAPEAAWHLFDLWVGASGHGVGKTPQACLQAGVLNWISLAYLGTTIPDVAWTETKTSGKKRGKTSDRRKGDFTSEELMRLSQGGIAGTRARMRYLAERGEDPAFTKTIVEQTGQLQGDELNKATLVAVYLYERGDWRDVFDDTRGKPAKPESFIPHLAEDLARFEAQWRRWILPLPGGMAERLSGGEVQGASLSPGEVRLLAYLNGIRKKAWPRNLRDDIPPVGLSRELSDGCVAHAAYLDRYPKQAARWPDAHEEYPDKKGFSPAGNRAGLNGVIAPGSKDEEDAIDGWMGTFYHRLPLLDPGLLRVGWGLVDGMAVMDTGSFVAPAQWVSKIAWPYDGMKGVPLSFNLELPHPVPGEDQTKWGYPITLQLFRLTAEADPVFEVTAGGEVVDCWLSTPQNPTNPELAPAAAYCLIPKQRLRSSTRYTVKVTGLPKGEEMSWSFETK